MRSSAAAYFVSVEVTSSVMPLSSTSSNPLLNKEEIGAATEAEAIIAEFTAEKRRSIATASCPLTFISPLMVMVESPSVRSLEVIVLKRVMFKSNGVRNESLATS